MTEIEVKIESVRQGTLSKGSTLMLKDKATERYLPIFIGKTQASRIKELLMGIPPSKRLETNLIDKNLDDIDLTSVVINEFDGKEFHAKLRCKRDDKIEHFSVQLTEAVIASIKMEVPILVDEAVLTKSGILV